MSYTPTEWETGQTITAEKLNKLEQGVANAGGGSFAVHASQDGNAIIMDKTYSEIATAFQEYVCIPVMTEAETFKLVGFVAKMYEDGEAKTVVVANIEYDTEVYRTEWSSIAFTANSETDYPTVVAG